MYARPTTDSVVASSNPSSITTFVEFDHTQIKDSVFYHRGGS